MRRGSFLWRVDEAGGIAAWSVIAALGVILLLGNRQPLFIKPNTVQQRSVVDERSRPVALPRHIDRVAVFMGIGIGEYLLVTRDPTRITTSRDPGNDAILNNGLLRRSLPGMDRIRQSLVSSEQGNANLEVLLAEHPSVLVTWARLAASFERMGLPVVGMGPIASLQRNFQNTALYAAIVEESGRAEQLDREFTQAIDSVRADVAAVDAEHKPQVLTVLPTAFGGIRAANAGEPMLTWAGGAPVANVSNGELSVESLLTLDPAVIIIVRNGAHMTQTVRDIMDRPELQGLTAVREKRVYVRPEGLTLFFANLVEYPLYTRWLAELLHPDMSRRMRQMAAATYRRELGQTPTDDELDQLLSVNENRGMAHADRFER